MTYDGALIMPRNCVAMTEDEMQYTEGGISLPNWFVGGAINAIITALIGGIGAAAVRYFVKQAKAYGERSAAIMFSNNLKNKLLAYGVANGIAAGICAGMTAAFNILLWATDPGGQLAIYFDARDKNPNNGWLDF